MALKRHGLRNLGAVLVLGGAIVGTVGSAGAQNLEGNRPSLGPGGAVTSGKIEFREYCAQCHGLNATGDGPVAPALKKKPANLTLLSKNNGGVFPEQEVRDFINGTKTAASHGTREMPIWGYAFMFRQGAHTGSGGPPLTQREVDQKINMLVTYVKSIQAD
ncbi:MAG TPA: c-type cytochrome [Candidatus Binataceae bacterium]|nr:c-type cytochrome [Candidatus Binataceae bacterium]